MRALIVFALVVVVFSAISGPAFGEVSDGDITNIALVSVGKVDLALQKRVQKYLAAQYLVKVSVANAVEAGDGGLKMIKQALAGRLVHENATCILALGNLPWLEDQSMVSKDQRFAIVNLDKLAVTETKDKDAVETFARRVEKESLRAVASMAGMQPCQFPRCALYPHKDDAQLDFKSRNPCPPCMQKTREFLAEMGKKSDKP